LKTKKPAAAGCDDLLQSDSFKETGMTEVRAEVVETMALVCVIESLENSGHDMQSFVNLVKVNALRANPGSATDGTNPEYKAAVVRRVFEICGIQLKVA
jgi:hypothetical protein